MGHLSSKAANESFDESTSAYLGPSGLHLGLESTSVSQGLSQLQGEVLRQTRSLQQVTHLTYEGFLASITELNEISGHFLDCNGKQLVFAVKKGSDSSFLWKATVRVACVKIDAGSKEIDSYRCLNLKQYLRVYNSLRTQSAAVKSSTDIKSKGNYYYHHIYFRLALKNLYACKMILIASGASHVCRRKNLVSVSKLDFVIFLKVRI